MLNEPIKEGYLEISIFFLTSTNYDKKYIYDIMSMVIIMRKFCEICEKEFESNSYTRIYCYEYSKIGYKDNC